MARWLVPLFSILALGFFVAFAIDNLSDIPPLQTDGAAGLGFVVSILLMAVGPMMVGHVWYLLVIDSQQKVAWSDLQIINGIAQFAKYLPGNVGHHIGRVYLAKKIGLPSSNSIVAIGIETVWGATVAAGLSIFSLFFFVNLSDKELPFFLDISFVALMFTVFFLAPWVLVWLVNQGQKRFSFQFLGLEGPIPFPGVTTAIKVSVLFLSCFLIMGICVKLHLHHVWQFESGTILQFMCLYSIAWLGGYLAPGAPGGLGIREFLILLVFTPVVGAGTAIGLGATLRLASSLSDLLVFMLAGLIYFFKSEVDL